MELEVVATKGDVDRGWIIKSFTDSFGSYVALKISVIFIVCILINFAILPYHKLEELRIKKLEDEAKEKKNEK